MLPRRPSPLATRAAVTGAMMAAALSLPSAAGAQEKPEFSTGARYSGSSGPRCGAGMGLMSSASYRGASVALLPAPVTSLRDNGLHSPVVAASVQTPSQHRWQLRAGGAVGRADADCAAFSDRSRVWGSVSRRFGSNELTLTVGGPGLSTLDPSRAVEGVTVGFWRSMARARVGVDVRQHSASTNDWRHSSGSRPRPDSVFTDSGWSRFTTNVPFTDSAATPVEWQGVDVRTRLEWTLGRLTLDFTVGGSTGSLVGRARTPRNDSLMADEPSQNRSPVRLWGRADARLAVSSFLEITGGVAALPAQPLFQGTPRRVATLGFGITSVPRLSRPKAEAPRSAGRSAPAPFETVRVDSSVVRVRVRVPNASRVELSGELTGWTPVPMQHTGDAWWETALTTRAGVYRMNLRVDGGAWTAPPGMPVVRDEFGGQVGLMPIR